ncbi:MAG TPA: PEP-CTERM sorting domain-containing protein [Terriglobales bacterium]|nr:PEP-CTERM sorting domain-containing protein [Terriglobales bacterium]
MVNDVLEQDRPARGPRGTGALTVSSTAPATIALTSGTVALAPGQTLTPEPPSALLLLTGSLLAACLYWRRRQAADLA